VLLEAYAVLTRLPSGLAVPALTAADVISQRFDAPPLGLSDPVRASLLPTLAGVGVFGGAAYDALVALEAGSHGETLATLDERAVATYRRVGVAFQLLS
jgi:hypothetical protein